MKIQVIDYDRPGDPTAISLPRGDEPDSSGMQMILYRYEKTCHVAIVNRRTGAESRKELSTDDLAELVSWVARTWPERFVMSMK